MRVLILGGTVFLGRHLVASAVTSGHDVTVFHRGEHTATLPTGVREILGDRNGDLHELQGQAWDAVIDTSGYVPRLVRRAVDALHSSTPHYTFISTISVYGENPPADADETTPVATLADPTVEDVTGATYGALKALCEQVVQTGYADHALIIRPGLIVGPFDKTDRFTYWPHRLALGGMILAPGDPAGPVQFIDARDLADWTVQMVEQGATGVFNTTGPAQTLTMRDFLAVAQATINPAATLEWVDEAFLLAQDVGPWMEIPLWLPAADAGLAQTNITKALQAGLTFRPLTTTLQDTLAWDATRPADSPRQAGLAPEREQAVLAAWAKHTSTPESAS